MGRRERRQIERKIKHLQKTKPWELQAMIHEQYSKELIDNRLGNAILSPGDKVTLDVQKILRDPDWNEFKPEYQQFVLENANKVFTLRKEARTQGPFAFVSFEEDEKNPKWLFYIGHVKKVKESD